MNKILNKIVEVFFYLQLVVYSITSFLSLIAYRIYKETNPIHKELRDILVRHAYAIFLNALFCVVGFIMFGFGYNTEVAFLGLWIVNVFYWLPATIDLTTYMIKNSESQNKLIKFLRRIL